MYRQYSLSRIRNARILSPSSSHHLQYPSNTYPFLSVTLSSLSSSFSSTSSSSPPSSCSSTSSSSSPTTAKPNGKTVTNNTPKSPTVPWGLIPRYAQRLPVKAYPTLTEFTPIGILNRPSWYDDAITSSSNRTGTTVIEDNGITNDTLLASIIPTSIGPQAEARAYVDALHTPRDEYIIETITKVTQTGSATGTKRKRNDEYRILSNGNTDKEAPTTGIDDSTGKASWTGGRRNGRRRSNSPVTTTEKNLSSSSSSSMDSSPAPASTSSSSASSTSASPPPFTIRSSTPEELDSLLLALVPPRFDSSLSPLEKSIRSFLDGSIDAFTLLLSNGLPYLHREYNKSIDDLMFHPTILQRLNDIRNQQTKLLFPTGGTNPSTTTNPNPKITIKEVKAARIIDTWSVWDSSSRSASDHEHSSTTVIPVNAIVRELGHSATIEVPDDSDTNQTGLQGIVIRLLNKFFHYYQLKPVNQVHSQITVAYLCVEEQNTQLIGEPLQDHGTIVPSTVASPDPSTPSMTTTTTTIPKYTIHTVTYEAQAEADQGSSFTILKYVLPPTLNLVQGWRIIDIDGHFGPQKIGYPELSFSSLIPRARNMSWRRAGLELRDAVSDIHDWCTTFQHVSETGSLFRKDLLRLRSILDRTEGGKEILQRTIDKEKDDTLHTLLNPLLGMLMHLEEAANDIADVQHNRPPWVKRTGVEIAYDKGNLRMNDKATITNSSKTDTENTEETMKRTENWEDDIDESVSIFLNPERPAAAYKVNHELTKLTAAVSPIFGTVRKNDPEYVYAQYGMHGKAIKDFVTRSTNSQQWVIAAYQAVRARISSSMGELHGRRLDSDILYQISCQGVILILPTVLSLATKYLYFTYDKEGENEKKEKDVEEDEKKKEAGLRDASIENQKDDILRTLDSIQVRNTLIQKIDKINEAIGKVKNLRIGGPTGSLFRMDDGPNEEEDDDSDSDDDDDGDKRKKKDTDKENAEPDPANTKDTNGSKLTVAEKEARKLDPARVDRIIFRDAIHAVYIDTIELLEEMEKYGILKKGFTKEELADLARQKDRRDEIVKRKKGKKE